MQSLCNLIIARHSVIHCQVSVYSHITSVIQNPNIVSLVKMWCVSGVVPTIQRAYHTVCNQCSVLCVCTTKLGNHRCGKTTVANLAITGGRSQIDSNCPPPPLINNLMRKILDIWASTDGQMWSVIIDRTLSLQPSDTQWNVQFL